MTWKVPTCGTTLLLCMLLSAIDALGGAVIDVPNDALTITAGLGVANSGDVVLVQEGFHDYPTAPLRVPPGVRLLAEEGTRPQIVTSADTALVFDSAAYTSPTSIRGFTISGFGDVGVVAYTFGGN